MRRTLLILGSLGLLGGTLWPQSANQPGGQSQAPAPLVKVQTRLVIVDVVAQDKKDRAVKDLQASDFKVLEDGKQQTVSVFAFQQPATDPTQQPATETPAPNVFGNAPRFNPKSALNVILLDGLNTTLLNQVYVRSQVINCLEKLPQGEPIAIYALGSKLRLLQDFTTDLTELKNVIHQFKGQSSRLLSSPTGTPDVPMTLQGLAAADAPGLAAEVASFVRETTSNQVDLRVGYTTSALSSLARMLAGYPGRKNLIWITEAVPLHIFANTEDIEDTESNVRSQRSYDNQLALVANLFADAQVSVYPVDARSLVGSPLYDPAINIGVNSMGPMGNSESDQDAVLAEAHSTMEDIAGKTGGKAFYNRNNLNDAILDDMQDGSTYYTLGYYPANKTWDGRFRKIQINVARNGVKVRYRLGYYALDRARYERAHPQQRDLDFSQALDPNSPVATALQFRAGVLQASETAKKLLVRYLIDPHQIHFETQPDGLNHAEVDCAARVFSPKDIEHPVTTGGRRVEANVKQEVYRQINGSWLPCEVSLDLPPGSYLLRLAVRDNITGLMGSANARAVVPENQSSQNKSAPR
jgi:VWFA-related protein